MKFQDFFISEQEPYLGRSRRDKFLSRVFGIFNEEIVRIWCANNKSPFKDLGRPTVYEKKGKHYTLDFLLEDRFGHRYVAEMKCELEYQKYRFMVLEKCSQIKHHLNKRAFQIFIELAKDPDSYLVKCQGNDVEIDGSILVWGSATDCGIENSKSKYGISDIISTEQVISDLIYWGDKEYLKHVNSHKQWCDQLFSALLHNS